MKQSTHLKEQAGDQQNSRETHRYVLENFHLPTWHSSLLHAHIPAGTDSDVAGFFDIHPLHITRGSGSFKHLLFQAFPEVAVNLDKNNLVFCCQCQADPGEKMCSHQAQVFMNILHRKELRIFFDQAMRYEKMKKVAVDYGLQDQANPDDFFEVEYAAGAVTIQPKKRELFPLNKATALLLEKNLFPGERNSLPTPVLPKEAARWIVVFSQHRFYKQLVVELYEAQTTVQGKIKAPLKSLDPFDLTWKTENNEALKFYAAISRFRQNYDSELSTQDIEALKALVKNPLQLEVYFHDQKISANITIASLIPVSLETFPATLHLSVHCKNDFYEISGQWVAGDEATDLSYLKLSYGYFVHTPGRLQLVDNMDFLRVVDFFRQHHHQLVLHASRFDEFRQTVLSRLEHTIRINYTYLRPATPEQQAEKGFDKPAEQLIYLTDSGGYVLITPVMRYGDMEIPVLSEKQVQAMDHSGHVFTIHRDEEKELRMVGVLLNQHPDFKEQNSRDSFYLHKERFLDDGWFLDAFEKWAEMGISVLGFNQLQNNKLSPNKARISVQVSSGVDWFDTSLVVKYGKQQPSLKQLFKAVRNKSKFVQLDDGTLGILPAEWIDRFAAYFRAGEIVEGSLRTSRANFSGIAEIYEDAMLLPEVKERLLLYRSKMEKVAARTEDVVPAIPEGLHATLRDYQLQGLQWLNLLDDLEFGGCLADDMGLGKTLQIIAFVLSLREKHTHHTHLVVVPVSLLFNWKAEVEKFAPSIRVLTLHGTQRVKDIQVFDQYELVLTSYGTLLSDIRLLKQYRFNYIFLDESQHIKNPSSQRYKAARLLQARNRIALTGTPVENSTFDLYGQLSFTCPGLLGSRQQFLEQYAAPIDKFKDYRKAKELQQKTRPFILRRTKEQVAKELPEKTEMTIYCEMGTAQRQVYDATEKEFREFLLLGATDTPLQRMHVLQGLTRLRQICNSPALLPDENFYGYSSSKIAVLMEQIESKAPHHKILVFSQFVSMLDLIRKELEQRHIGTEYLTGKTRDREKCVNNFQDNPEVRVFLISLKAGGTGLNLTQADYVYLVDPWWNPAVENQAIDRCHRIGQENNVVAVRLVCPDTIEDKIQQLQQSKKELAQDLVKTDGAMLKSLSRQELLQLVS